jgi:hypothetical protein
LQRDRKYDDETQHYDRLQPVNAPKWSYVDQGDILIDTDIDMPKTGSYFYDLF